MRHRLTEERAAWLARVALDHVGRDDPDEARPAFGRRGRVQGDWMLARLLARGPNMASAPDIRAILDRRFTAEGLAGELALLEQSSASGLDGLHGWAWLLKLAAELRGLDDLWSVTLAPLAEACADRFMQALAPGAGLDGGGRRCDLAFALSLARDYAVASRDDALLGLLWETAVDGFGRDRDGGAEGPGGGAPSPALMQAECMRRLLPAGQWRPWFDAFLPDLWSGRPASLFRPALAGDPTVEGIAGRARSNLGRAWCWRGLAGALPADDPRRDAMEAAGEAHLAAALGAVEGDASGAHGLAALAVLALDA